MAKALRFEAIVTVASVIGLQLGCNGIVPITKYGGAGQVVSDGEGGIRTISFAGQRSFGDADLADEARGIMSAKPKSLLLPYTRVTNASAEVIASIPTLQNLTVAGSAIDVEGVGDIARLSISLQRIWVDKGQKQLMTGPLLNAKGDEVSVLVSSIYVVE